MNTEDNGQSGYYQTIAREFLARRGAPFLLSPRDQAAIAAWEAKRVPLDVVLEGIGRTFDGLKARAGGPKGVSLAFCERQVEAALAQHRDRSAGRGSAAGPRPDKKDRARREVEKGLRGLGPDDGRSPACSRRPWRSWPRPSPTRPRSNGSTPRSKRSSGAGRRAARRARPRPRSARDSAAGGPTGSRPRSGGRSSRQPRDGRKIPHVSLYYY